MQQFLREILDDASLQVEHPFGALWTIKGREYGVAATTTWGTEDIAAPALAQLMATQSEIVVRDTIVVDLPDGGTSERHPVNVTKTIAAQAKADELAARFAQWLWEDPTRAAALHRTYNERFNAMVLRSYDGIELSLPGLALTAFQPKPHQYAAVARMIAEPACGLYHEVGAGKTFEMIAGIMEQRRLGLIRKAAVVVPNHMLEQFAREWQQLYPRAKLLLATSADLSRDRRRAFIARVATGDWDAVIVTRTAFEKIPMSPQAQAAYLDAQVGQLRAAIERARAAKDNQLSLKRMERALTSAEERIKAKLDTDHDPALTFEMTGIDYVVVDEAHGYKNLRTVSNVSDVAIDGSNRASDLEMKLHYLRGLHGGRVGTFATATPIANKLSEAWVMMRYLRPDLLEAAGVADIDAWLATFAQCVSAIELGPAGGFRIKSRVAKFHNLPEMLQMWLVSGDVKTAQDLNLDVPQIRPRGSDGARAPETIVVPPTAEQVDYVASLADRAEAVRSRRVTPDEDNMLAISNDGRAAALDPRLVGLPAPAPGEGKLAAVAAQVIRFWEAHRGDVFLDKSGRPHPVPGAFQIVFCDLSTPNATRWNAYDELRDLIAAGGVPREQIRFIHEAGTDQTKAELFAACRDGRVAVLLGSTEKMGVGTNVQDRLGALHDVDCPWRPADLAQRLGRIIRQGNQFTEVAVFRYVTEATFDAYMWQAVTRKAIFIAQAMRGTLDVREMDDIGDQALNANEVKALATGDPLILDKAQADADLNRLERLKRAHDQTRYRLRDTIRRHEWSIEQLTAENDTLQHAIEQRTDTRGDAFTCVVRPRDQRKTPSTPSGSRPVRRCGRCCATAWATTGLALTRSGRSSSWVTTPSTPRWCARRCAAARPRSNACSRCPAFRTPI